MLPLNVRNNTSEVRLSALSLLSILLAILLAALIGRYLVINGVSYRELIVVLVFLIATIAVLAGEQGVYVGFILWVWTLSLGYRTVELTSTLRIHPSEVLLWGLLALLVVQRGVLRRESVEFWLPRWLWLLIPFWLWAWGPGIQAGRPWDRMFAAFRNFVLLIPLMVITVSVLEDRTRWRAILLAFYGTGTWIAGMGVLEYLFPDIRNLFPGFVAPSTAVVTDEGFLRALYTFWGTPAATFVCLLSLPMAIALWTWYSRPLPRLLLAVTLILQLYGIYIGGYRSVWLITSLEFVVLLWLRMGIVYSLLAAPLLLGLYRALLGRSGGRLVTLLLALQGQFVDGAAYLRWNRAVGAMRAVFRHPLGLGWAGKEWVHSDFLQVAVNLGLLAGLFFVGAYLVTLWRVWRQARQYTFDDKPGALGFTLFPSFVAVGGILALEGVETLPQLVLPVWLVWILVEVWLRQQRPS